MVLESSYFYLFLLFIVYFLSRENLSFYLPYCLNFICRYIRKDTQFCKISYESIWEGGFFQAKINKIMLNLIPRKKG